MKKKKYIPKEGDIFRFLITSGDENNGFTIYGYGRVLNTSTAAFYSNTAHPPRKIGVTASIEQILALDVAFVVGCTFDGFDNGLYEVIGNVPLENKFKSPIYFYHRSVADDRCSLFNVWDSSNVQTVHISEMPVHIERWGTYSHIHVEKRLGIYRGKYA